ncbi:hypothetical protein [Streptomyces sp. MI02-7b]|uniref:hypothetical protein n=1 Tax=Streptomyces sp. MI02-7b TaxID=462941 RepID=UPI0029A230FE|nr:hypothetical protein [Streptomyces sp. MI02-7b]MDX3075942.1 hypothetical protein [Streptomyces sp. MI02-7b]
MEHWADQHPPLKPPRGKTRDLQAARPMRGRHRRLPLADNAHALNAPLGERSCLPWKLGELLTSELNPASGGWAVHGRA